MVAWTCTSRAVFHIASTEVTPLFSKMGVLPQRELEEMLELRWHTNGWLHWRCRRWRTSISTSSRLIISGLAAVIYRLAITSQDETRHFIYGSMADAIPDCQYSHMYGSSYPCLIGRYTYLIYPAAGDSPIFVYVGWNSLAMVSCATAAMAGTLNWAGMILLIRH